MKLVNADALKQEIKSNADLGQWDIQEVIRIIDNFPEVTKFNVKENDVIVIKFHNEIDCELIDILRPRLKHVFPNNEVIFLADYIEVESVKPSEVISQLENIIKRLKGET